MTTKRTCCSQQIALCFHLLCLWKGLLQECHHDRHLFRTYTTAIKTDTGNTLRLQLREQFLTQDFSDDTSLLMKRIDALRMEKLHRVRSRLQGPVGLRTTTICYQNHAAKVQKKVKKEKGKVKKMQSHVKIMNYGL